MSRVTTLAGFEAARTGRAHVLCFFTEWYEPCRLTTAVIETLALEYTALHFLVHFCVVCVGYVCLFCCLAKVC